MPQVNLLNLRKSLLTHKQPTKEDGDAITGIKVVAKEGLKETKVGLGVPTETGSITPDNYFIGEKT